jgi:very-short-patch-repair endonuclease/Arc/MetJ family transcription regulator
MSNGSSFPADSRRVDLVNRAVSTWTGELIDLGGRNTLLYYRDLKQGTLDMGPSSGANGAAVDALLASRSVRLSTLFAGPATAAAARRARTIKAKATENFEERGLQTLFLAWGMATWVNQRGSATPAAPVLLRQATLTARGGTAEDFDVSLPGDWEVNPTLIHLLKTDHQVDLAQSELLDLLDPDAEPPNPAPAFERLDKAGSVIQGFSVSPRVVVGNFSYAKLPMVQDLMTATDTLVTSDLIGAIAGDEAARDAVRSRHPSVIPNQPDRTPPADEFLVLDADASQSYAINCAVGGADLVINGPPGTGKSQTIANLIATLSARGRRILFVAEKRAAIEAVLDRLRAVGLAEIVLDLHDGVGSKRKLAAELARTLEMTASIPRPDMTARQETLARHREVLVERTDALHDLRDPWGISVYDIYARLAGIPATAASVQRFPSATLVGLSGHTFRQARADLDAFVGLGGLAISQTTSPWAHAFATGTITTPDSARAAIDAARTLASHTLPATSARLQQVVGDCGLRAPQTVGEWIDTLGLLNGVSKSLSVFDPAIFDTALDDLALALAPASGGGFRRLWASIGDAAYRRARKSSLRLWKTAKPRPETLLAAVKDASTQSAAWRQVAADGGRPRLPSDLAGAAGSLGQLYAELQAMENWDGTAPLATLSMSELEGRLHSLLADAQTVSKLPELARLRSALQSVGLWPLVEECARRNLTIDQALACADHVWLSSILDTVSLGDRRIGGFDGQAHSRTVAGFGAADRAHIATTSLRVRRAVAENVTRVRDAYPKESEIIQHQAHLKRRHLPVRQLFQAAPHVLGALRPCWAMSPLVVSQLLPAERYFDVVIFDEASQVTPADAVGALMRADQAVVAGDPHQLPPTTFFAASGGGEDDEEAEAEELGAPAGTRNMESILDVMAALLPPPNGTRTLSWHYRSKDERLIAFSNAQPSLYDWSLTTFPGVAGPTCLSDVVVPFRLGIVGQDDSISDEVLKVVELVAEHARSRPTESLGVIAMGIKHANRIAEALRQARKTDPELDAFLDGTASEQARKELYFVKNLERVQGDERDAIILTIGYGKSPDGRMLYRFGPINNEGGERRLNVAITRARSRMTVVSSFSSADMDPARLRSEGAKMLSRYLAYAESSGSDLGNAAKEKPELNPFERDVEAQLSGAGIPLIAQYGCSGYWIDFAAQHPARRGLMVLAVECDGATYHSSATARDRDRLRQEHLERLGWTFHRIWSQEWFFHREAEIARAVAAYQAAVAASDAGDQLSPTASPVLTSASGSTVTAHTGRPEPCPVWTYRSGIDDYSHDELVAVVRWIESDTLLRTEDALLAEAMRILHLPRKSPKITAALTTAITKARSKMHQSMQAALQAQPNPPAPPPPPQPSPNLPDWLQTWLPH